MSDVESRLYQACRDGNKHLALDMISRLVAIPEHNRVIRHDDWDSTPLHESCRRGWLDVVQLLVEKVNHEINVTTKRSRQSPLHISCRYGGVDIVRCLTKHGCNPVLRDWSGKEPLDYALDYGYNDIVHYICTHCITSAMMLAPDRSKITLNIFKQILCDYFHQHDWKTSDGVSIVETACHSKLIAKFFSPTEFLKLVNAAQARIDDKGDMNIPHFICHGRSHVSCIPSVVMMEWLEDTRLDPMKLVVSCNWKTADGDTLLQLVCQSETCVSRISSTIMQKWLIDTTLDLTKLIPNYKTAEGHTLLRLICQSELCVSRISSTEILKWLTDTNHDLMELDLVPNYKTADGDTLLTLICQTESCVSRISSTMFKTWLKQTNVDLLISGINWKTADGNTVISIVHQLSEYGPSLMHIHPSIIPTDIIITPHWKSIDCKVLFLMFYRSELCISQTSSEELLKWLQNTNLDPEKIVSPNWKTTDGDTLLQLVCQSETCLSRISSTVMTKWLTDTTHDIINVMAPQYKTANGDTLFQLACQSETCLSFTSSTVMQKLLNDTTLDLKQLIIPYYKTADGDTLLQLVCRSESCVSHISSAVMLKWLNESKVSLKFIIPNYETACGDTLLQLICQSESCVSRIPAETLKIWLKSTTIDLYIDNTDWKTLDSVTMTEVICHLESQLLRKLSFGTPIAVVIIPSWENVDGSTSLQILYFYDSDSYISHASSTDAFKWLQKTNLNLDRMVTAVPNWKTADGDTLLQLVCKSESCISRMSSAVMLTLLINTTHDLTELIVPNYKTADADTLPQLVCQSELCVSRISSTVMLKWLIDHYTTQCHDLIVLNSKTADGDTLIQLICQSESCVSRTSSTLLLKLLTQSSLDLELILPNFKTADGKTLFQLVCQSKSCVIRMSSTVMLKWLTDTTLDLMELMELNHETADGDTLLQLICRSELCVSRVSSKMLEYSFKSTNAELLVPSLNWKTADGVPMSEIIQDIVDSQLPFHMVELISETHTDVVITPHWETDDGSIVQVLYKSEWYISQLSSASLSQWLQRTNIDVGKIVVPYWKTADGDTLLQIVCQSESCVSHISSTVSPSDGLLDLVFHSEYLISQITSQVILNWLNSTKFTLVETIDSSWKTKNGDSIFKLLCTSHFCLSHISSSLMLQWLNDVDKVTFNILKLVHPGWTTSDGDAILHLLCKSSMKEEKVVELLQYYLQQSILNPNLKDSDGNTALHLVCKADNLKCAIVSFLVSIDTMLDINDTNKEGLSPLEMTEDPEIMEELIQHGAKVTSDVVFNIILNVNEHKASELLLLSTVTTNKRIILLWKPTDVNDDGDTALHLACKADKPKVVTFLLTSMKLNLNVRNHTGLSALEMTKNPEIILCICQYDSVEISSNVVKGWLNDDAFIFYDEDIMKIFELLIRKHKVKTCDGSTLLHLCCGSVDLVFCDTKILVNHLLNQHHDPNVLDKNEQTPLQITSDPQIMEKLVQHGAKVTSDVVFKIILSVKEYKASEILLLSSTKNTILWKPTDLNDDGDTALHLACKVDKPAVVKYILKYGNCNAAEKGLDINEKNKRGLSAIEMTKDPKIMEKLVQHGAKVTSDVVFNIILNVKERKASEILLLSITKKTMLWRPTDLNDDGDTALHLACKADKPAVVKYILKYGNCNAAEKNLRNKLPIELTTNIDTVSLLIEHGATMTPELVLKFAAIESIPNDRLTQLMWNPDIINSEGNTALHLACRFDQQDTVNFLLSQTHCDPNVKNNNGEVPLQMTTNLKIIKDLIRYGAQTSIMYKSTRSALGTNAPIKPPVKMFVVGNPSVGKSTLTEALKKKLNFVARLFTSGRVSGVEKKTVGIIPHEIESDIFGRVTVYDFAGHREFYSGHAALLKAAIQSTPPVFLLVVNLLDEENKIFQNILYWISFLENQCTLVSCKPHLIIVGSHADTLKSKGISPQEKVNTLVSLLGPNYFINLEFIGFIPMDCQLHESTGMNDLRPLLVRSCSRLRIQEPITFNAHCFLVYLLETFKEAPAVTINTIHEQIEKQLLSHREGVLDFLPKSTGALYKICVELNERGHILFLRDKKNLENSYVVTEEKSLLSEVSGTVFASEDFKQYKQLATNTGIVSLSKISECFPGKDVNILIGVLTHLEFCHEISDQTLFQLISERYSQVSDERYYLFPGLISINAKESIWDTNTDFDYSFGWMLHCTKPEQFFSSRFLQVLLLRLAFSFAFDLKDLNDDPDTLAIHRKCSLWKNGIFWGTHFGMDILVEIVDNKTIVVMARFKASHLVKCIGQRSQVLHTVVECVQEFCPRLSTVESFIETSTNSTMKYPFDFTTENSFCTVKDLAEALVIHCENPSVVLSESGKSISAESFYSFEPYAEIEATTLEQLLDKNNDNKVVSDVFLSKLVKRVSSNLPLLIKIFNEEAHIPCSKDDLYQEILNWRDSSIAEPKTYSQLRNKFDQHSVFTGRNVLVSTILCIANIYNYSIHFSHYCMYLLCRNLLDMNFLLQCKTMKSPYLLKLVLFPY